MMKTCACCLSSDKTLWLHALMAPRRRSRSTKHGRCLQVSCASAGRRC
ncbi:hypothetical protein GQ600_19137 [Phytophthora cactorum]|nr:hypothetical protein GQ600_19137 [Phytophthora cactorum]